MEKVAFYPTDSIEDRWKRLLPAVPLRKARKSRTKPPADLRRISTALNNSIRSARACQRWRRVMLDDREGKCRSGRWDKGSVDAGILEGATGRGRRQQIF